MRKITLLTFILSLVISIASVQTFASVEEKTNLKILDVQFDPIRQGKNIVRVKVQNTSEQDQTFRLQIYTRSPNYGRNGGGVRLFLIPSSSTKQNGLGLHSKFKGHSPMLHTFGWTFIIPDLRRASIRKRTLSKRNGRNGSRGSNTPAVT
jgi:hypothetical protein